MEGVCQSKPQSAFVVVCRRCCCCLARHAAMLLLRTDYSRGGAEEAEDFCFLLHDFLHFLHHCCGECEPPEPDVVLGLDLELLVCSAAGVPLAEEHLQPLCSSQQLHLLSYPQRGSSACLPPRPHAHLCGFPAGLQERVRAVWRLLRGTGGIMDRRSMRSPGLLLLCTVRMGGGRGWGGGTCVLILGSPLRSSRTCCPCCLGSPA
mmetsp:Transcript_8867/g.20196  ORF Transcript_8867/g.20196 Transcript_8867/m.20196 type:complete len:205 (+) Transcript_8867:125-739(+)